MTSISVEPFNQLLRTGKLERKEYQFEGVKWMLEREDETEKIRGGILADEMGLGKTIQILGTMLCNFKRRTLIIVPSTLLEQWHNTIYYFTGHKAQLFHGKTRPSNVNEAPIVLTTYHMVKAKVIQQVSWNRIVMDEAHHIRNPKTKIYQAVTTLKREITWLVTGTPIQNKKKDITVLFETIGVEPKQAKGDTALLCMEFLLKRTKKEANIQLPGISFHEVPVNWSTNTEVSNVLHSQMNFNCGIDYKDNSIHRWASGITTTSKLPLYTKCKQLCIMPALVKVATPYATVQDASEVSNSIQNTDKLDMVVKYMTNASSSSVKKMVFCSFRKEMDYMKSQFVKHGISSAIIDGRTTYNKKSEIFSQLPEVLILQVNTCCEGLNLQMYKQIYFTSPQWNPSIEDQAVARCHRVGQRDKVDIFHFKMSSVSEENQSLENYICKVQEDKRKIYI